MNMIRMLLTFLIYAIKQLTINNILQALLATLIHPISNKVKTLCNRP